jgi:hypothetical protein
MMFSITIAINWAILHFFSTNSVYQSLLVDYILHHYVIPHDILHDIPIIFPLYPLYFPLYRLDSNYIPMIFSVYPVYSPLYQLYPIRLPFDLWYSYYLLITWLVWQPIFTLLGPGRRYLVSLSDEILDRASWSWLEGPNHPAMAVAGWESPYGL